MTSARLDEIEKYWADADPTNIATINIQALISYCRKLQRIADIAEPISQYLIGAGYESPLVMELDAALREVDV